jgi:hypothetical protein
MSSDPRFGRFIEAYLAMAERARYRPAAPGDGMGFIFLSEDEAAGPARLRSEAAQYTSDFLGEEEEEDKFSVGCSDFNTSRAFVCAIEAARLLATGEEGRRKAVTLLQMATEDVERTKRENRGLTPEVWGGPLAVDVMLRPDPSARFQSAPRSARCSDTFDCETIFASESGPCPRPASAPRAQRLLPNQE